MTDTYLQALLDSSEPHEVLLGPSPCCQCGAWVEWAGTDWLALGTRERHTCSPFMVAGRRRSSIRDQAHPMVESSTGLAYPQLVVVPYEPGINWHRLGIAVAAALALALLAAYWPR
jgi:hypothetical protein